MFIVCFDKWSRYRSFGAWGPNIRDQKLWRLYFGLYFVFLLEFISTWLVRNKPLPPTPPPSTPNAHPSSPPSNVSIDVQVIVSVSRSVTFVQLAHVLTYNLFSKWCAHTKEPFQAIAMLVARQRRNYQLANNWTRQLMLKLAHAS